MKVWSVGFCGVLLVCEKFGFGGQKSLSTTSFKSVILIIVLYNIFTNAVGFYNTSSEIYYRILDLTSSSFYEHCSWCPIWHTDAPHSKQVVFVQFMDVAHTVFYMLWYCTCPSQQDTQNQHETSMMKSKTMSQTLIILYTKCLA